MSEQLGGESTKIQVLFLIKESYSDCMACFHSLEFGLDKASKTVRGSPIEVVKA